MPMLPHQVLCKNLCLHVLIVPALAARCQQLKLLLRLVAVRNEAALREQIFSLDLGFDVNSCNLCEAALQARINF